MTWLYVLFLEAKDAVANPPARREPSRWEREARAADALRSGGQPTALLTAIYGGFGVACLVGLWFVRHGKP